MSGIQRTGSQRTTPPPPASSDGQERTVSASSKDSAKTPGHGGKGKASALSQGESFEMGAVRSKRSPRTYPVPESPAKGSPQGGLPPFRSSSESFRLSEGGLPLPATSSNPERSSWFGRNTPPLGRNPEGQGIGAERGIPPASPGRSTLTETSAGPDRPLMAQGNATGDRPYEVDRHRMAEEGRNVQDQQFSTQQEQIALQRQQLAWQKAGVVLTGAGVAAGTTAAVFSGLNYAANHAANKPG